jgi:hypothetical protein
MMYHGHAATKRGWENSARGTDVLDQDVVLLTVS